jgi:hypothetical protein
LGTSAAEIAVPDNRDLVVLDSLGKAAVGLAAEGRRRASKKATTSDK